MRGQSRISSRWRWMQRWLIRKGTRARDGHLDGAFWKGFFGFHSESAVHATALSGKASNPELQSWLAEREKVKASQLYRIRGGPEKLRKFFFSRKKAAKRHSTQWMDRRLREATTAEYPAENFSYPSLRIKEGELQSRVNSIICRKSSCDRFVLGAVIIPTLTRAQEYR